MGSKHDAIQAEIVKACNHIGFNSIPEFSGKGWRADVLAAKDSKRVGFEVQLSPQSLQKTLERQQRYIREGITGCWLFEKAIPNLNSERPDLPLFFVAGGPDGPFTVSLGGRKELPLHDFLEKFLSGGIKFCETARALPKQPIGLDFYAMKCWKCGCMNHIYSANVPWQTACNAEVHPHESLWGSDKTEYRPEVIALAKEFVRKDTEHDLRLGDIKKRYSKSVEDSYTSFGCYWCDSIFGDWFIREMLEEATWERYLGSGQSAVVAETHGVITLGEGVELEVPHWCYPGELRFCDE